MEAAVHSGAIATSRRAVDVDRQCHDTLELKYSIRKNSVQDDVQARTLVSL